MPPVNSHARDNQSPMSQVKRVLDHDRKGSSTGLMSSIYVPSVLWKDTTKYLLTTKEISRESGTHHNGIKISLALD
jgi:hypothetical protein